MADSTLTGVIAHVPRRLARQAWGGTERVLEETVRWERAQGVRSEVFTTRALDPVAEENVNGMSVRRFAHYYPEWPLSAARRSRYDRKGGNLVSHRLAQALGREPHLLAVHCHTANRLGAQCLRAARQRGVPCFLTLHGGYFAIPATERRHLQAEDLGRGGIHWGRILSWWWQTRALLQQLDGLVCVGLEEYEAMREQLPDQRVLFLPGGVDIDQAKLADPARGREILATDGARPLLVCLARLDEQKDQPTLVEAWAGLTTPCDLALVGPETTPGYVDRCQKAGPRGPGRLIVVPGVSPDKAHDVLAAATIVVLPSRHEPFGLVCIEAWAVGRPVVASDVGGPAWLLADERAGLLFPPGDVKALRSRLERLLDNPGDREQLGAVGQRRASRDFSWKERTRKLWQFYRECGAALPRWE